MVYIRRWGFQKVKFYVGDLWLFDDHILRKLEENGLHLGFIRRKRKRNEVQLSYEGR